jgi:hypothetical protein
VEEDEGSKRKAGKSNNRGNSSGTDPLSLVSTTFGVGALRHVSGDCSPLADRSAGRTVPMIGTIQRRAGRAGGPSPAKWQWTDHAISHSARGWRARPLLCSHGPMDTGAFCSPLQLHRAPVVASQELLVAAQFSGVAFVVDKEHNW